MEQIYNPHLYSASENINIKEFSMKLKRSLNKFCVFDIKKKCMLGEFSGAFEMFQNEFNEEEKKCLEKSCSLRNLDFKEDFKQIDLKGKTLQKMQMNFKKIGGFDKLKTMKSKKKKDPEFTPILFPIHFELPPKIFEKKFEDLKPGEEVVISISVFRPFKYQYAQTVQKGKLKFFTEITVLGSNTLANFKDMINCPSDNILCKEVSESPDFELNYPSSKDIYTSSFIFIDGVFYNDFRTENSVDYSDVIRYWAMEKKIGNFDIAEMSKTQFKDLSPRIGYPYIYQHKACCEHIIVFSQVRMLNSDDPMSTKSFPYYTKLARSKDRYCVICGVNFACWVVKNSDRLPQNNAPLCTNCFKSYNYIDDKKIGNFEAYPFINSTDIL